jgi:hypothetical protein
MITIKNREKYTDNEIVSHLLNRFEKAHREQNPLHMSVILAKLKQYNITIRPMKGDSATQQGTVQ